MVWQAIIAPYRHYRERFAEWVTQGAADGSLRATEPPGAARVIVSLGVGLVLQAGGEPGGAGGGRGCG